MKTTWENEFHRSKRKFSVLFACPGKLNPTTILNYIAEEFATISVQLARVKEELHENDIRK